MQAVNLADAKPRLSELDERAEAGDAIDIARRGKPVTRLTAVSAPRRRIEPATLRTLTDTLPRRCEDAARLVRSMRHDDRC